MHDVNIVNPAHAKKKARRRRPNSGKKKPMAARKKTARKRATPRRRRRTNASHAAPRRRTTRRRRRRNPSAQAVLSNPRRRRSHRRRNPGFGLPGTGELINEVKAGIPRLFGKLAVAAATKFVGGDTMGGPSSLAGEPWGWKQYGVAIAVAALAPKFLGGLKFINATEFRRGAVDLILTKAVWTNVINRFEPLQRVFGAIGDQIYDMNQGGQGYAMDSDGQYHALQGLVTSGPLDGLVTKGPLDGLSFLPGNTPKEEAIQAAYAGRGTSDPYAFAS